MSLFWRKEKVSPELRLMLEELAVEYPISNKPGSMELEFIATGMNKVTVKEQPDKITVEYTAIRDAAKGLAMAMAGDFCEAECEFKTLGVMFDCSRNAVFKPKAFKSWLRKLALMGYNTVMLYTEDTYKLPGEEYFGYMRGAYTHEELRDINQCAMALGIDMIPCIQVLGHLEQILKWDSYSKIKDNGQVLLIDSPESYDLIEKMIRFWHDALDCRRIHIGMDETHGMGRGNYMDLNGIQDPVELYNRHLGKVNEICRKHGMKPLIWSDMYCRLGAPDHRYFNPDTDFSQEIIDSIPRDIDIVYWDYYHQNFEFYDRFIQIHRKLGVKPVMATGLWTWTRLWCDHDMNVRTFIPCLEACRQNNLDEVIFTLWGDNGSCCDIGSALADLCWASDMVWSSGEKNRNLTSENFKAITNGGVYEDHLIGANLLEGYIWAGYPENASYRTSIGIQCLLWDDPLQGILCKNEKLANPNYAETVCASLDRICDAFKDKRMNCQAGDFNHLWLTADFLRQKIRFRERLEFSWQHRELDVLSELTRQDLPRLIEACSLLTKSFRTVWMRHYKPFGLEILQIRQGGQLTRLQEAQTRLNEYVNNIVTDIPELNEKVTTGIRNAYCMEPYWASLYQFWSTGCITI